MGYRAGTLFDPSADPRGTINQLCEFLETSSGNGLRVRYRDPHHLVVGRKRLAVFGVALMISTLVPGPGFLLGYWFIHRNAQWSLALRLEPQGPGSVIRWNLTAPIEQAAMDAVFAGSSAAELPVAIGLISGNKQVL